MSDRGWATGIFVRRLGLLALVACACVAAWQRAEGAAPEAAASADVAALVQQLGDPIYAKRRAASERLLAIGLGADGGLRQGLSHGDPEIARQCRFLLCEVRANDLRRRIDAFAADEEGKREHALPYWDQYRKIAGDDRAARDFFLEMLKAEGPLLEIAAQGTASAREALQARWVPLVYQARYGHDIGKQISARNIAAWLLVLLDVEPTARRTPETYTEEDPFESGDLFSYLQDDGKRWFVPGASREPLRKILGHWVLRASSLDQVAERLQIALRYRLKESLVLAAVLIESKAGLEPYRVSLAAAAIGLHGGKTRAAMLEPLLAIEAPTQTSRRGRGLETTIEGRDIALAWLVEFTGQDHTAYGMPDVKDAIKQTRSDPQRAVNNLRGYGFPSESAREAAMAKWHDYVAAHPLAKAPPVEIPKELTERLKQGKDNATERDWRMLETHEVVPEGNNPFGDPPSEATENAPPPMAEEASPAAEEKPFDAAPEELQPADPPGDPEPVVDSAEDAPIANLRTEWADRDTVRKLKAAEELADAHRYGQAARLLNEVLEEAAEKLFLRPQKHRVASSLRMVAEEMLAALPKEGLRAYQAQCQVKARRMLAEAVALSDGVRIAAVADRYFFTLAGAEAALLTALADMDHGEFARAALQFEKIRRKSPDAVRLEPQLSLRAAACLLAAGDGDGASRVLGELEAALPGVKPMVAGRIATALPTAGNGRKWFEAVSGWRGVGGASVRAVRLASGVPLPRGQTVAASLYEVIPASLREKIEKRQRDNRAARLPSSQPVAVGQTAVFRTPTRLAAVDAKSGELLWDAPVEDDLRWLLEGGKLTDKALRQARLAKAAQGRLFSDAKFGGIACDGRRVFGIEGTALDLPAVQRIVPLSDGKIGLDAGGGSGFNYLTAYDVHTGKLVWSLGGPPKEMSAAEARYVARLRANFGEVPSKKPAVSPSVDAAEIDLSGAIFLGPPVCWEGRLLAVVAWKDNIVLAEIDAARGKVLALLLMMTIDQAAEEYDSLFAAREATRAAIRALSGGQAQGCACEGGIAVCGIGEGRFAAVDIVRRRLLWACTFPEETPTIDPSMMGIEEEETLQPEDAPGWLDTAVMIVADRAILMPRGADRLDAVNLATGMLEWSLPRADGVFCVSPSPDVLLIVGRGGVRAVQPRDGKPLWAGRRIDYPARGVVCGRGFACEVGYCLPLSSGEILVIDALQGRIVGRSRTLDGDPPGNLLACGEVVLSCGAYGTTILPTVSKSQPLEAALADGEDPAQWLLRAERLLALGRSTEAARLLKAYLVQNPSDALKRMLADALLMGLALDEPGVEPLAAECESLLSSGEEWPRILWEIAAAADRRGQRTVAFAAYLRCLDGVKKPEEAVRIDALRTQSALCRVVAQLEDLYRTADDAQRADMDQQISAHRADPEVRKFVARFGWHPSAADARLELAKKAIAAKPSAFWAACASALGETPREVKGRLEADGILRRVLAEGDPRQRREATARLAALFASANRNEEAAWWYRRLRDEMGDVACLDGKTGRELYDALKADSPIRTAMDRKPAWPMGKVRVEASSQGEYFPTVEVLSICAADGRVDPCPRIFFGRQGYNIVARDLMGRDAWTTEFARPDNTNPYGYYDPQMIGWWMGNVLVVAADGMVCAYDGYGRAEAVWSHPRKTVESIRSMSLPVQQRDPLRAPAAQAQGVAPSCRAVCFAGKRGLTAVDTYSGKVLWTREDFSPDCDLFGDGEILLVTPPEADEAVVLRVSDGCELGRRRVGAMEERLSILGRKVVSFTPNGERPELAMQDAWTGETLWKRSFAAGAKAWLVASDEAALLEREGRFSVVRLTDGATTLAAQADPAEKLDSIYVLRAFDRYILIANGAVAWAKEAATPAPREDVVPVSGRLYGFERVGGKRLWACNVVHQAMQLGQDPDLPILVFFTSGERNEESKTSYYQKAHVLDTRTGETLYRRITNNRYGASMPNAKGDFETKTIHVGSDWGTITLTFTDEPR